MFSFSQKSHTQELDRGIVYSNRVKIGNWYESATLEEYKLNTFLGQMKKGDLMLARYRKMTENLIKKCDLTQSSGPIPFGAKIALLAPHIPVTHDPDGEKGLILGGRISSNDINYSQELKDGCHLVGIPDKTPSERCAFVVTSADYCDRVTAGEPLKYNQEFLLALSASVEKKKPLYIRYDPNAVPGLFTAFPLYLSENAVSNTRWRVLPKKRPDITRFEQEGQPVQVNTDVVINHCATNVNLGFNTNQWSLGFYGRICSPQMKTCLDVYGRELPNNIWNFYVPILD
ncbi:hypothetical protein NE865_07126 [Phthorimaea operculella]|nr:hypothetical protein NE865_07126 [Phthorimaea operculella]